MKILNLRDNPKVLDDPNNVYIGRAGRGQDGFFGNPFGIGKGAPKGATLDRYLDYFVRRIERDNQFKFAVQSLAGRNLVCFCSPDPCHGEIMRAYIQNPEGFLHAYHTADRIEFIDAMQANRLGEFIDASLSPPPTS